MAKVRTVLGDIAPSDLGVTNAHEHLLTRSGLILKREPDFRLDSVEHAISEVQDFQKFGGQSLVDTAPIAIGRDPDGLIAISRATKAHIIACTGFHKSDYYLDSHWRFHYPAEKIASLLAEEIEQGMDRWSYDGPFVERSSARAGVIKVATGYQNINPEARVVFEAAAIAHRFTGAPILTHTEMGTVALEQVKLLDSWGVKPTSLVLSHVDRNPDWAVHRDVAQTGAFMEYDGAGRVKYFPESTLVELIRKMFDASLGDRILLGGDTARRSYWKAYGGGPGLAYLLEHFVPRLRREGFGNDEIDQMLVANPARAFAFKEGLTGVEQAARSATVESS